MIGNFPACWNFLLREDIRAALAQDQWEAWLALHKQPSVPLSQADVATASQIFFINYWNPNCDFLPKGVDLMFLDASIEHSPVFAVIALQQVLGIEADGHFGVVTAACVQRIGQKDLMASGVIQGLATLRRFRYAGTKRFSEFGSKWMDRVQACTTAALGMANGVDPEAKVVA